MYHRISPTSTIEEALEQRFYVYDEPLVARLRPYDYYLYCIEHDIPHIEITRWNDDGSSVSLCISDFDDVTQKLILYIFSEFCTPQLFHNFRLSSSIIDDVAADTIARRVARLVRVGVQE